MDEMVAGVPDVGAPEASDAEGRGDPLADDELHIGRGVSHDHHGRDGGRETLTGGEAQHLMHGVHAREQDLPAMAQNNATDEQKLAGILAQTRADLHGASTERLIELLLERCRQAGVPMTQAGARRHARLLGAE